MSKKMILFIIAMGVMAIVLIGVYGPNTTQVSLAVQEGEEGCASCHEKLSDTVPESHFNVTLEEVKYCLVCHSLEGPATAFDWTTHLAHYAQEEFSGDCWSCHLLDEEGGFRLIGAEGGKGIEVTEEVVEGMGSYFVSWATSECENSEGEIKLGLDHKHANQGVTCALCHGTYFPQGRASMEQCLGCHGSYEHVATLTEDVDPNPHRSHLGEVRCTLCHRAHEESVFYCNECHVFQLEMP